MAGEVRALAGRTTAAARGIKALIQHSQQCIDAGVAEVGRATEAMGHTAHSVAEVRDLVGGIHVASEQQLKAITEISGAVASLDGITQQNAAMVEQLAASAMSLQGRAEAMKASVQVFRTRRSGAGAPAEAVDLRRRVRAQRRETLAGS